MVQAVQAVQMVGKVSDYRNEPLWNRDTRWVDRGWVVKEIRRMVRQVRS